MEYKKFGNKFVVRLDKGEEVVETLKKFCGENNLILGGITGIGSTNKVKIGLFNTSEKKYYGKEFTGDYEITALNGNISTMNGEVYLHIHASIADDAHTTYGGHLNYAVISGTCEIIIDAIEGSVGRVFDQGVGLNIYKF